MNKTLSAREKIYNHINGSTHCGWSDAASNNDSEKYCIAKDTIQDTGEALLAHREKGFSPDIGLRYVEYYGVIQAVYMQQDAIHALYRLFMTSPSPDYKSLKYWNELRGLRNHIVGHPVGNLLRLNRNLITYPCVNYMRCTSGSVSSWKSSNVDLGALVDGYDSEAAGILETIWSCMEAECTGTHGQK